MRLYTRTSKKAGTTKLYIKPKFGKTPTWINTGLDVSLTDWDKTFSLDEGNNLFQSEVKVNNLMWKIQCKLPPKTKRFCPLVLK